MAKVALYNMNAEQIGDVDLNDSIFAVEIKEHLVHRAVQLHLANKRQGTQSTLTRAEVRGGGRKPWQQKGTGRARHGSIRSPQWVGGGVTFGPKPRDYSFKMNKKEKLAALKSALTSRVNANKLVVVDELDFPEAKTKNMKDMLNKFETEKALIVTKGNDENVILSARNIPCVKTINVNNINVYDILKYNVFVITKDALNTIEEVYS